MKMRLVGTLILALVMAGGAGAEMGYRAVSVTDTSQTQNVNTVDLLMVNDGSDAVYFRLFDASEPPEDATASNAKLDSGESIGFDNTYVGAVSVVCDIGGSATLRMYWR